MHNHIRLKKKSDSVHVKLQIVVVFYQRLGAHSKGGDSFTPAVNLEIFMYVFVLVFSFVVSICVSGPVANCETKNHNFFFFFCENQFYCVFIIFYVWVEYGSREWKFFFFFFECNFEEICVMSCGVMFRMWTTTFTCAKCKKKKLFRYGTESE